MSKPIGVEILYDRSLEDVEKYSWNIAEQQLLRQKISLFANSDKVSAVYSNQFTGLNRHSKKRWFRWETTQAIGLRRNHKGTIVPFAASKQGRNFKPIVHITAFDLSMGDELKGLYKAAIFDTFGITDQFDVYPMLKRYDFKNVSSIPRGMHKYLRLDDEKDFVKAIFGNSNYRRDLLKAVCSSDIRQVAIAAEFKGLVPIDWIINWLNIANPSFPRWQQDSYGLRKTLVQIDPRSYRRLLQDTDIEAPAYACDIVRHQFPVDAVYARSFLELHDIIWTTPARRIIANEPIKQLTLSKAIHATEINGLVLKTAQETKELEVWGREMKNCIAGYAYEAKTGTGIYGAVERDGNVFANFEIKKNKLRQLLGKCNQSLPDDTRTMLVNVLTEKGVDCSGQWWGKG